MKTKFILVGAYPNVALDGGKGFCAELLKDVSAPARILICFFARPRAEWSKRFEYDKAFISGHLPGISFEAQLAEPEQFVEQARWANVIYLKGGDLEREQIDFLEKNSEWLNHIENKTVAGTSAGADALSKYFYAIDRLQIETGLGVLPIKMIPHYLSKNNYPDVDWPKAMRELNEHGEKLLIVALREGEFKVLNV